MYKILTLNKISSRGLDLLPRDTFEVASEIGHPDAILVRSQEIPADTIPGTVMAIARAGAGTNNIPVSQCSERGVVVFNTPGANANSVKELTLAGLFLASRKVFRAVSWVKGLAGKGEDVPHLVEKNKSSFTGGEIKGKKLGLIGLGAIGVMVANDAESLGMDVSGYDPFISIDAAWGLSRTVKKATSLDVLLAESDYISIHAPLTDKTRGILNSEKFAIMKKGVKILNFSRGGLVNNNDLIKAIKDGIVDRYITDFPEENLLELENVIPVPHLGASTPEAEENCAIMASLQVRNFLETGNIKNSVNFPDCEMAFSARHRITIANKNVPNMVGQITTILADSKINISDMLNRHKGDYAYNIIDVDGDVSSEVMDKIKGIQGVICARLIEVEAVS